MSTTSAWIANMRSLQSPRNRFANTQMAIGSSTPQTQTRSSTPPLGSVPRCAFSPTTSAGCSSKICQTGSPTSPATSNMPTPARRQRPQWWRKVSWGCQPRCPVHQHVRVLLLQLLSFSDCRTAASLRGLECPVTELQRPAADLDDSGCAAGKLLAVIVVPKLLHTLKQQP